MAGRNWTTAPAAGAVCTGRPTAALAGPAVRKEIAAKAAARSLRLAAMVSGETSSAAELWVALYVSKSPSGQIADRSSLGRGDLALPAEQASDPAGLSAQQYGRRGLALLGFPQGLVELGDPLAELALRSRVPASSCSSSSAVPATPELRPQPLLLAGQSPPRCGSAGRAPGAARQPGRARSQRVEDARRAPARGRARCARGRARGSRAHRRVVVVEVAAEALEVGRARLGASGEAVGLEAARSARA